MVMSTPNRRGRDGEWPQRRLRGQRKEPRGWAGYSTSLSSGMHALLQRLPSKDVEPGDKLIFMPFCSQILA